MEKRKLSYLQAAKLEFAKEPMDDYYNHLILGIPSRWRVKKILNELGEIRDKRILDVGCEAGYVAIKMAQKRAKVFAIDIISEPLKIFKEKLKKLPKLEKNITIRQADARKIPTKNSLFDFVVATEVIEHMPSLQKFAKEAQRVLKHDGKLIITFPNEDLRKNFYPFIRFLGINTEVEEEVTLYSYQAGQINKIFSQYFNLVKNYSLPFFLPITNLMIFEKR